LSAEFRMALEAIQAKLMFEPETWGDPQYPLRKLDLLVYHRLDVVFRLLYAVDSEHRIVYVKDIKLRPGSWFADAGAT
jgi:mRNA-degrading endonuclease RelE of RelBE toxin-antitoxin system